MNIHQFGLYSFEQQYEMLKREGIFLMNRYVNESWLLLFAYQTFYVEVVQVLSSGKFKFIRCFDDIEQLEPYISQINIHPIIKN